MSTIFSINKNKSVTKVIACIVAIIMLLSIMFSSFFIAEHLHHECTGEDCPICAELHIAEGLVSTIKIVPFFAVALFAKLFMISTIKENYQKRDKTDTLISLKVELLD